jgi:hypothetical protein
MFDPRCCLQLRHCLTFNFLDIRYATAKSPAPKSAAGVALWPSCPPLRSYALFVKDFAVARRSCQSAPPVDYVRQILLAIVLPAPLGFSMRNDTECGHIS